MNIFARCCINWGLNSTQLLLIRCWVLPWCKPHVRVSLLFTIISFPTFIPTSSYRVFLTLQLFRGSTYFDPFIPDLTGSEYLIPPRSAGNAMCISRPLNRCRRRKVFVLLCRLFRTSAPQLSSPSGNASCLFFFFNILCLCVQEFAFMCTL